MIKLNCYKGSQTFAVSCYTILNKSYIIHTFSINCSSKLTNSVLALLTIQLIQIQSLGFFQF